MKGVSILGYKLSNAELLRLLILMFIVVSIIIPVFVPIDLPIVVTKPVRDVYDKIQSLPEGSLVVLGAHAHAGNYPEIGPIVASFSSHLLARKLKMLAIGLSPESPALMLKAIYGTGMTSKVKYGTDWVMIGYIPENSEPALVAFRDNFAIYRSDFLGNPTDTLPMMQQFKSVRDAKFWIMCLGTWFVDTTMRQIQPSVPVAIGILAGAASDAFPYYAAGTLTGVLTGVRGAAEYETLTKIYGDATLFISALDLSHIVIVGLVVAANVVGYRRYRELKRSKAKETGR